MILLMKAFRHIFIFLTSGTNFVHFYVIVINVESQIPLDTSLLEVYNLSSLRVFFHTITIDSILALPTSLLDQLNCTLSCT